MNEMCSFESIREAGLSEVDQRADPDGPGQINGKASNLFSTRALSLRSSIQFQQFYSKAASILANIW